MIFDGEQLTDLMEPLELGWRERCERELALMDDLISVLRKRAEGPGHLGTQRLRARGRAMTADKPSPFVPKLRFSEFRDAPDWEEVSLGTLLVRAPDYGVNAAAVPFSETLPTYIRITDINSDGQFAPCPRVSVDSGADEEQYLRDGDIVLARTGASVGKSYRYREEDGRLVYAGISDSGEAKSATVIVAVSSRVPVGLELLGLGSSHICHEVGNPELTVPSMPQCRYLYLQMDELWPSSRRSPTASARWTT